MCFVIILVLFIQRGGQPASHFGFGCQYKFSGGQNGFETENGLASPLPHTGHTSRWRTRRRLSLPSTAMSGAGTLTPERVDQRSFTRCMVLDALVERGVASASLAKPRRSVLQLKTMLKDLLAGGGDAPMVPASARSEAAAQQLVGATSGTGMTLTVRKVLDPTAHKLPDWQVHLGSAFRT